MQSESSFPLRYALAGMIAMAVAMGIGRFVYTPILPGMMESLGLSASDAGAIASANFLGYLVGAILASGGWAESHERPLMLAGLAATALLAAWMGWSESFLAFVMLRFLAGVASAFVMVFLSTIVLARLANAGRGGLQALHFGGVGVGIAVSAVMTGALYLGDASWRAGWFVSGAICAAGFLAVLAMVRSAPRVAGPPPREPALPRDGALYRVILAYGLFGFGYIVTATFLVAIVREGDAGRLFESVVWLATGLAGIPSVWLWGLVVRRLGLTATFSLGCLVEAAGVVASVSLDGYAGPLLGGVLLGGTFIAVTALGLQAGRMLVPQAPRRTLALMTAAFGVGQILGPIVAGYLADWTGSFALASMTAAAGLFLSAAIAWRAGAGRAA